MRQTRHGPAAVAAWLALPLALALAANAASAQPRAASRTDAGSASQLQGQRVGFGVVSYEASLPTGDADDYLAGSMSWIGVSIGGHRLVAPNATIGLELGLNEFHERTGETIQLEEGAVTGEQYRHLLSFPIVLGARYYGRTGPQGRAMPFAGLGLGAFYTRQLLDIGVNEYVAESWQFGVAPEAGVLFFVRSRSIARMRGPSILQLRVRYNHPISSGEFLGGDSRRFSNLTFSIGAGYQR